MKNVDTSQRPNSAKEIQGNTAIQNNFHFTDNLDLDALGRLPDKVVNKFLIIYEKNIDFTQEINSKLVGLEENEQKARISEIPFQRIFVFSGQALSFIIATAGMSLATFLAINNHTSVALTILAIPVGVVAVNFLGITNKGQKN